MFFEMFKMIESTAFPQILGADIFFRCIPLPLPSKKLFHNNYTTL